MPTGLRRASAGILGCVPAAVRPRGTYQARRRTSQSLSPVAHVPETEVRDGWELVRCLDRTVKVKARPITCN